MDGGGTRAPQKRVIAADGAVDLLRSVRTALSGSESFTRDALHDLVQEFVARMEIRFGAIAPALRLCVTGKAQGADLFGTLELLGKKSCLARIDRAIGIAESHEP